MTATARPAQSPRPRPGGVKATARIGCSGWQYRHWRGTFYPQDLVQRRWLEYYASQFDTVEINNTFYRLPEASAFAEWSRQAPAGFLYAVKASRFLTHMKKLKDPEQPLDRLFSRALRLGRAFGPVLYQLPPRWGVDLERLETFVRSLPRRRRHVIEFRDPSWYTDVVFELLARHHVACCIHDMAASATGAARSARLSTPGFTVRHDTVADTTIGHWTIGLHGSPIAFAKAGPFSRISTMTPAATRLATRCGSDSACRLFSHGNRRAAERRALHSGRSFRVDITCSGRPTGCQARGVPVARNLARS